MPAKRNYVNSAEIAALESLLALHFSERRLVPSPNRSVVHREWYLREAGFTSTSKEAYSVLEKYDELAAAVEAIDDAAIAIVDAYIQRAIRNRTLAMQSGRIIAARVGDMVGFSRHQIKNPLVVSRLDHWTAEVAKLDYVPDSRAITKENREWAATPPASRSAFRSRTLSKENGKETSISKLTSVLTEHRETNSFIRNELGRLDVGKYSKLIGNKMQGMTPAQRKILFEFERNAPPEVSDVERKIPKIKAWFQSQVAKRSLPVRDGKIEEQAIMAKFAIGRKRLKGCQPLLDAISEFNSTLALIGYKPKELFELENALLRALPTATLFKTNLTIDRVALARRLKTSATRLSHPNFAGFIEDAEAQHRARIAEDPLWACFPERAFDFSPLINLRLAPDVVHRVCKAFSETFSGSRSEKRMRVANATMAFFARLAQLPVQSVRDAFNAISNRSAIADHVWHAAIDEITQGVGKVHVRHLNAVIQCYGDAGVLPRTAHRVKGPKRLRSQAGRPSVAELIPKSPEAAKVVSNQETGITFPADVTAAAKQYVSFAHWILLQKASWNEAGADFRGDEFLAVLQTEIENWKGELPRDPVQAISQIIKRRLTLIGEAAKTQFDYWRTHFLEGQKLLSRGVDPSEYEGILFDSHIDPRSALYLSTLRRYFPANGPNKEQGLANLLRLIQDRHGGMIPVKYKGVDDSFFTRRCSEQSSTIEVQARLVPHRDMHASALVMYLVESGCNVAVALTLFHDCIEDTDSHGFKKITGYKARANGKPIVLNLPEDSVAVDALSWLADNNTVARSNAPDDIKDLLFITRLQGGVTEIDESFLRSRFRKLIESITEIASLRITPVMMRPSVLLQLSLENDGDLRVGLAYAQHDISVTGVYQVRLPTKYIYDQLFSQFQVRLHRIVQRMSDQLRRDSAPVIEPEAKPIGMGGVCQVGGCNEVKCWNNCSNLVVIPELHALADWQIWNKSLKEVRSDWEADRIERWEAMWLPFLCFTDVLEDKMKGAGASRDVQQLWEDATELANSMMSRSDFIMPRPF